MKRDYLGHAVTLALAIAASAVINAKCPPEPVPAGPVAPPVVPPVAEAKKAEAAPAVAPVAPVAPVVAPPAAIPEAKGQGL